MKVLLVHNFYRQRFIGGEDIIFQNELKALKERLGEEKVFIYTSSNDSISISKIPFSVWYSREHFRNVYKMVKKYKIEIVHVHNTFLDLTPSIFEAAHVAGAKVIQTLHNYRWWCPNGVLYNQKLKKICEKCVNKKIPFPAIWFKCGYNSYLATSLIAFAYGFYNFKRFQKFIDRFIVMTEFAKQKVISFNVPKRKVAIKPNFVPVFAPTQISHHRNKYLFVGRVDYIKGIVLLLETWKQLPNNLEIHIVGAGPLDDYVRQVCSQHKNIFFHGKMGREEVFNWMARTSFLIMPSLLYETFGLTVIEAMSVGTPVLVANIGHMKEWVKDWYNGFLFDLTQESLKSVILKSYHIEDDHYLALSKNAINFSRNFSKEIVIDKLISIYKEVLDESHNCC